MGAVRRLAAAVFDHLAAGLSRVHLQIFRRQSTLTFMFLAIDGDVFVKAPGRWWRVASFALLAVVTSCRENVEYFERSETDTRERSARRTTT